MATIGDRVATVQGLLGGRTDQASNISEWIANGYRDIAHSIPVETLEQTANLLCTPNGSGQAVPLDTLDYPDDARAIKSLVIGVPAAAPTSQRPLYKRNMAILDRYATNAAGVPSIWAPFNSKIYLRQIPDQAYPVTVRYWQAVQIDSTIDNTEIAVPDDWLEIVDYAAQIRGYIALQEPDKAQAVRVLLYGNPKKPGMPGLIKQRLTRIQAEYENANYGMRPRRSRYANVK